MGTNCAPLLADIFLYSYEVEFIQSLLSTGKKKLASQFNFTYRYIDEPRFWKLSGYDVSRWVRDQRHDGEQHLRFLLGFTPVDREWRSAAHIPLRQTWRFQIHITNFPFLRSNIPSSPAYGVFISQLIRYARACSSYECFILRAARLSSKLLGQERLKSSPRKFFGRYGDVIKHYEVSLSQMLHDILGHGHIQWHPQMIKHYTN